MHEPAQRPAGVGSPRSCMSSAAPDLVLLHRNLPRGGCHSKKHHRHTTVSLRTCGYSAYVGGPYLCSPLDFGRRQQRLGLPDQRGRAYTQPWWGEGLRQMRFPQERRHWHVSEHDD